MALAKDQIPHDSSMGNKVQTCVFNHKSVLEQEHGTQSTNELSNDSGTSITHSPPLCGSDNGYVYKGRNYQLEEAEPLINFKESSGYSNIMQASESLLSFQQSRLVPNNCYLKDSSSQKEYCVYENNMHQGYQTASGYSSIVSSAKEKQHGQSSYGWLYSEPTMHVDSLQNQKSRTEESVLKKRPAMGENMKATKKQCSNESKAPKPRSSTSKDPQSVAAKNRRERISERLKILQELVPNGSKVDLVTMLEKAISYVKFLQLQVKVLATDEFWPVQGGKPPDISQVKEAIEAILSSQRDRSSSSK